VSNEEPVNYRMVVGSHNPIANSAIVAANSIISFGHDFVVVPPAGKVETEARVRQPTRDAAYDPTKIPGAIVVSSAFTIIFSVVVAITVMGFVAEVVMAVYWPDPLSALQERVSSSADWAFKAGFGAILGLLGGKQTNKASKK
jgi:hypothetical protein